MNVGFLGFGRMGAALAKGAIDAGVLKAYQVSAFDPNAGKRARLLSWGGKPVEEAASLLKQSTVLFLAVKPQKMDVAVKELLQNVAPSQLKKICFVSIAAGLPLSWFELRLGKGVSVFRVMPNTPAIMGAGMSVLSKGRYATKAQEKTVLSLLKAVGKTEVVKESLMDAVTALSGSGPAYVFYLAEALVRSARKLGLSEKTATLLARQTIFGAGVMLKETEGTASELRAQVTSPGGTTEAAIQKFDELKLTEIVERALQAAAKRSQQLSRGMK